MKCFGVLQPLASHLSVKFSVKRPPPPEPCRRRREETLDKTPYAQMWMQQSLLTSSPTVHWSKSRKVVSAKSLSSPLLHRRRASAAANQEGSWSHCRCPSMLKLIAIAIFISRCVCC